MRPEDARELESGGGTIASDRKVTRAAISRLLTNPRDCLVRELFSVRARQGAPSRCPMDDRVGINWVNNTVLHPIRGYAS